MGNKIYIRADGNNQIATGHIMRCLTIARALLSQGAIVMFLVADSDSEEILNKRLADLQETRIGITNLKTKYNNLEEELPLLCQFLMSYPCDALLIDSYFVNPGYLETLSRLTRVAYIDDVYAFPYPVDLVINYAAMPEEHNPCYQLAKQKLLGLPYAPIREMFQNTNYQVRPSIQKILLSGGGILDGRCYLPLLEGILDYYQKVPEIHLLMGSGENIAPEVKAYLEAHPAFIQHGFVQDMATFLEQFDLVFSAAGTTLYELTAMGIPTCSFISADNQIASAIAFEQASLIPCVGNTLPIPLSDEDCIPFDAEHFSAILKDRLSFFEDMAMREKISSYMAYALDKKGALRIAQALLHLNAQ